MKWLFWLCVALALVGAVWSQVIYWSHPDETSARMWLNHWPEMLASQGIFSIALIAGVLCIPKAFDAE